jgi:hypothetical protein
MVEAGKTYTMRMGYGEEIVAKITALDSSTYTLEQARGSGTWTARYTVDELHCLPQILRKKSR